MKIIVIIAFSLVSWISFAQVAIGKTSVTSPDSSLEFADGNKGIILPWVNSAAEVVNAASGTIIYDVLDKKVKIKLDDFWKDLSIQAGEVNTVLQSNTPENANSTVILGANSVANTTAGVLVLSDTDKAMVLPKMDSPHLNIKNPEPGMMAYDTLKHQLAFFNGSVWTFWKP